MTIEPYNYNDEPSGRTETLVQALDKCERLEKQLKIAIEALKTYADERTWYCCLKNQCAYVDGFEADQALKQIKELEK